MSNELYRTYRPKTLEEMVGQQEAVDSIRSLLDRGCPHSLLITGPTGVGKTTLGRIIRRELGCSKFDYHEKDCTTEDKPLQFVKELRRSASLSPMKGNVTVWFLEEFQSLTRSNFSQQALLKLLEDCPRHVYFMLATTDPDKVLKTIRSRSTEIRLSAIAPKPMATMLHRVIKAEGIKITEPVIESIIEGAEGGMRKALVILEQVGHLKGEKAQLKGVDKASVAKDEAIKLARLLIFGRPQWPEVAKVLRDVSDEEPESMRYMILGYAKSCLIGSDSRPPNLKIAERAYSVIDLFSRNFYDSKHAGLAAACWEFFNPS